MARIGGSIGVSSRLLAGDYFLRCNFFEENFGRTLLQSLNFLRLQRCTEVMLLSRSAKSKEWHSDSPYVNEGRDQNDTAKLP